MAYTEIPISKAIHPDYGIERSLLPDADSDTEAKTGDGNAETRLALTRLRIAPWPGHGDHFTDSRPRLFLWDPLGVEAHIDIQYAG